MARNRISGAILSILETLAVERAKNFNSCSQRYSTAVDHSIVVLLLRIATTCTYNILENYYSTVPTLPTNHLNKSPLTIILLLYYYLLVGSTTNAAKPGP
jgi:hypothetical protein